MVFTGSYPWRSGIRSHFFSLFCCAKVPEIILISSVVCIYHTLFSLALADTAACKKESFHFLPFFFSNLTTWVKVEAKSQLNMNQSHQFKYSGKWLASRWLHEPAISNQSNWLPKYIKLKANMKCGIQDVFLGYHNNVIKVLM